MYIFTNPPSERNIEVHFTRPPCIFAKFAIKTEVRRSRFAPMTFLSWFSRTAKSSPKFSGDASCTGTSNRFSTSRNKIFASISYSRAALCRSIQSPLFLSSEYVCTERTRSITKRVMTMLLLNAEWMQLCDGIVIADNRHSCRKRNVFSSKCQGGEIVVRSLFSVSP